MVRSFVFDHLLPEIWQLFLVPQGGGLWMVRPGADLFAGQRHRLNFRLLRRVVLPRLRHCWGAWRMFAAYIDS